MGFQFHGRVPASKSILNRLLVIQSFSRGALAIAGDSTCDDVTHMRTALQTILSGKSGEGGADCGAAGTTFRFLALRASRIPGKHFLAASAKLLSRPQTELIQILRQLGVPAELQAHGLAIESRGWQRPSDGILRIDRSQSSQFASAVLLCAWELDFDLELNLETGGPVLSEGYFAMTVHVAQAAGMEVAREGSRQIRIPKGSRVLARLLHAESDLSSCFALAALAAVSDRDAQVCIQDFPTSKLQPDAVFPELLSRMGVAVKQSKSELTVRGTGTLKPLEAHLGDCPDLFPVLATLCAFAEGTSHLFGAPHLVHKESNRLLHIARLLEHLGCKVEIQNDGLLIHGRSERSFPAERWDFDPQDDHRLAMAAAVARLAGSGVRILHPEVVTKSFPEFWDIFVAGGGRL